MSLFFKRKVQYLSSVSIKKEKNLNTVEFCGIL